MLENLVAYVVQQCNTIKGKKAFQKIFYFLTEQGIPTGLDYTLYHYGPYSATLDHKIRFIEEHGAIKVLKIGNRYDITIGEMTNQLANDKYINEYKKKIDAILDILPLDNPLKLELLSTTHYAVLLQKEIYDSNDVNLIVEEVKSIKNDKFSVKEIYDAYNYLKKYKLLS
ncbi:hypothetical protein [Clostridium sp. DJ247]|uniref:hypothetical protein n=1 Tax=Clostridium sp. DJ247 TaxID=2726188 RepID=UPI001629273F|nr:hypothetical protein [Clostridium sp. DJ247]MBC2579860.1 hypothetical protein [Clostridium sp. DJ247]